MKEDPLIMLNEISQIIYDKKGFNIFAVDVKGVSSITDYILIAEGNIDRHVISIAKAIIETLDAKGETPSYVEGLQTGDWIVLDYWEIMIHLFMPGFREKYQLERLWQEGKIVDLQIAMQEENS